MNSVLQQLTSAVTCRRISFVIVSVCVMGILFASSVAPTHAEDWLRFRGNNGSGISDDKGIPTTWSAGDYAWSISLPGEGHGAPIIVGDKLFVTSATDEGALRFLFCLNSQTGEEIWSRVLGFNRSPKHTKNSWASSTPTSDGERIYFAFADKEEYSLSAYDFEGELVWRRKLGEFKSQHGLGASPVIFENMVIIANDQDGPSSIIAFDRKTGETVWNSLRSFGRASYATPLLINVPGQKPQLIVSSDSRGISGLDPYNGEMIWYSGDLPARTVGSPAYGEGLVFQCCGGGGIGKLMVGVDPTGQGNVSATHVKMIRDKVVPYVPTPVVYQGHLYLWGDNGVVSCVHIATGENIWTERIGGNYSSSPICIDGKLYGVAEDGEVAVMDASPKFNLYGKSPLGDTSHSTPSVANGKLYLRSFHRLSCLSAKP
ncbi:MAG: PQQ-binding-like beta-propeller repeat protein [Planctomycetaceae bacterium]